ncbi:hypothetical protein U9M48_034371 [Paspalum notatum var. saurae]|uniref:Uncharacterized protein n=1 Tax=Paspalum notatum var. saurae TaxID=547442 RepID=A0AAQ3UAM5_PASNO
MQLRPRIRGRDPHPLPSSGGGGGGGGGGTGGRYRRRSRSPRRPQRRSPERAPPPRRYRDGPPLPDISAAILLEAGRLAAHYLVAQGVLPDHVLRAREDPTFPAAGQGHGTELLLDDAGDPRSRSRTRPRPRDDDDFQAARWSRWDRRSHSFDGSRKYHDAGDADRGGRRTPRDYDEPRRPAVSRSYSHNERRPSADDRPDPSRRSRSRTYYAGSRRDSHCTRDADETPRRPRVPSSAVVAEANGTAHQEAMPAEEEGEIPVLGRNHTLDISEDVDAPLNDGGDGVEIEMDVSDVNAHLSDPVEDMEAGDAPMDACTIETLGEDNGSSQARDDEMEAPPPQREVETGSGDLNSDEQDLPAWYGIFDLNVVETPEVCEMTEIPDDPPPDHVSDSVGWVHHKTYYGASENQGQDVQAGNSCLFGDRHDLSDMADEHVQAYTSESQYEGEHAEDGHHLSKYDLNNEAIELAQDSQLLDNGELLLDNEQRLLHNNADEQEQRNHWMQIHPVSGEQLILSHDVDGYPVSNHEVESVPKSLLMGVYDLRSFNLKSEQTLLNDGADKHAPDSCHLKDRQVLFDQSADGNADMTNERTIPMINVEDDDEEKSDTREFFEFKG